MRIAYVNKTAMDSALPAVNFSLQMTYALAEAGADVLLLAQRESGNFLPAQLLERFEYAPLAPLQIKLFTRARKFGLRTNQWFYLWAGRVLRQEHSRQGFSAVLSRDPGALPYLVHWQKKLGVPAFYQPHNFYAALSLRDDPDSRNARKYQWLERRWIPKLNGGLLCILSPQAELYRRIFPGVPIRVFRPGMVRYYGPSGQVDRRLVGYVGSLQLKKGVDFLLRAFSRLQMPGAKLLLIGGRNRQEVTAAEELVRKLGLSGRVEITGWVPFAEVRRHLARIAVGVLPLRDTFYNRYLTAPNKLFDYLSHAVPMVASDLPSIRDIEGVDQVAVLVPPEDESRLAEAIHLLLSDSARWQQMRDFAGQVAPHHIWKKRAGEFLKELARFSLVRHSGR